MPIAQQQVLTRIENEMTHGVLAKKFGGVFDLSISEAQTVKNSSNVATGTSWCQQHRKEFEWMKLRQIYALYVLTEVFNALLIRKNEKVWH